MRKLEWYGRFLPLFRFPWRKAGGVLLALLLLPSVCCAKDWDKYLAENGYVNVQMLDSTIKVYLFYATPFNFTGKAVYQGLTKAWLHPDAAKKLVKAQKSLKKVRPGYSLIVYDAARPVAIQRMMWNLVEGTPRDYYVTDPSHGGGRHNYGMAVDVTIADSLGRSIPMGTPFDYFGEAANTDHEEDLLKDGKITRDEYDNRLLLRKVMREAGFSVITSEWWHFNACSSSVAKAKYKLIE